MRTSFIRRPLITALAGLAVATCSVPTAQAAKDEWVPGVYMSQAIGRVMGGVRRISDDTNYGYDSPGYISLMGCGLAISNSCSFTRDLSKGVEYVFIGGGDDDATDVDIEVLDSNGNTVARDTKEDASPFVSYKPSYSGRFTVKLTLYAAKESSFCAMAVLRSGGIDVPKENVLRAAGGLINMCDNVAAKAKERGNSTAFLTGSGQWAIYGSLFQPDQDVTITTIEMGTGTRCMVAYGDTQTRDIDLFLLSEGGKTLDDDTEEDANPVIVYNTEGEGTYGLKIKNAQSNGVTLIMSAILKID